MKVLSDKAQNKVICVFLLIGSIGLVVYGVTHIFSSIEYKLSSDVRQVTAVVKDYQISVKTDEKGDEDVKYHAFCPLKWMEKLIQEKMYFPEIYPGGMK